MDCNHASSNKAAPTKPSKNHVRKLLIILLLIGITIGLWLAFREPVFQGESAGYWLDRMDSDTKEEASVSAFKALGKPGVLFLVKRIKEKRVRPGESWIDRLAGSNLPLPKFIRTVLESRRSVPPIDRREQALHMLRLLGPDAEPALPELMREFKARVNAGQTMEYWDALPALEATGDTKVKYVPEFINALQNDWEPTVMDGAILLGSIGPKAKAAVPVLLERMPAGDWALSNLLTEALWKIDRPTNLALEVFTNELLTVRRSDQPVPLRSLGEMGPAAKPAASLVLPLLTNSDERLRMAAAKALSEIDPALFKSTVDAINQNPTASIERLLQVITKNSLEPKSRFASMRALEALAVYGPDARSAVPVLIEILQQDPPKGSFPGLEWKDAIDVLSEIGPEARSAVPSLIALLPAKRIDIHPWEICRALGNIGPGAISAVPTLKQILQSGDPRQQIGAATALSRIIPEEKSYLAPILMMLTNCSKNGQNLGKDPQFSWPARVALWRLGLEKELPIAEMMPRSDSWQILVAVPLLGDIGPAAKPALPYLEQIVDSDPAIIYRRMAAIAIRKIDAQEAVKLQLPGILALP